MVGQKSWKLIARTISTTSSLFVAQRPFTYSQGNMEKFWGDYRWGRKSGVLRHKSSNISERVKIEEKLLWMAYRKSPMLFQFFGTSPYFYFRFRLYTATETAVNFCLTFARTAQQSVLDGTNGLSGFKPCPYCHCQIVHRADIFAIAQLSCKFSFRIVMGAIFILWHCASLCKISLCAYAWIQKNFLNSRYLLLVSHVGLYRK